jgi:hypothetical protein
MTQREVRQANPATIMRPFEEFTATPDDPFRQTNAAITFPREEDVSWRPRQGLLKEIDLLRINRRQERLNLLRGPTGPTIGEVPKPLISPQEAIRGLAGIPSALDVGRLSAYTAVLTKGLRQSIGPSPETVLEAQQRMASLDSEREDITFNARMAYREAAVFIAMEIAATGGDIFKVLPQIDGLTDSDRDFATRAVAQARASLPIAPETPPPTPEEARRIISGINRQRSISTYGIQLSASLNFREFVADLMEPRLPAGMTLPRLYDVMKAAGFTDPEIEAEIAKISDPVQRVVEWIGEVDAKSKLLKSNLGNLSLEELSRLIEERKWETVKSDLGMALLLPVEFWNERLAYPLGTQVGIALGKLERGSRSPSLIPGLAEAATYMSPLNTLSLVLGLNARDAQLEQLYDSGRRNGMDFWEAGNFAFENWSGNWMQKFILATLGDPLTYFGFGVTKVFAGVPVLRSLYGAEIAYQRFIDSGFIALQRLTKARILRSLEQSILTDKRLAKDVIGKFISGPINRFRAFHLLTATEMAHPFQAAGVYTLNHGPGLSLPNQVGSILVRRVPITVEQVSSMARRIGGEWKDLDNLTTKLSGIDKAIGDTRGLGGAVWGDEELAHYLSRILSDVDNARNQARALTEVQKLKSDALEDLFKLTTPDSPDALLGRIYAKVESDIRDTAASKVAENNTRMGIAGHFLHEASNIQRLVWAQGLEKFQLGVARSYLVFTAYNPFNILENALKTLFMVKSPFFHGNLRAELEFLTSGLANKPDQLFLANYFDLLIGPGREAEKFRLLDVAGMSARTKRLLARGNRQTWLQVTGEVANDFFFRAAQKITHAQMLNHVIRSSRGFLREVAPDVMGAFDRITMQKGIFDILVDNGFSPSNARDIASHSVDRLSVGIERMADLSLDYTPSFFDAKEISKILSHHNAFGITFQDTVLDLAQRGQLLVGLNNLIDGRLREIAWMEVLSHPDRVKATLGSLVDDILANPARTLDELKYQVGLFQDAEDLVTNILDSQFTATQLRGRGYTNLAGKKAFYDEFWTDSVFTLLEAQDTQAVRAIDALRASLPRVGLEGHQLREFNNLLDAYFNKLKLTRLARENQRADQEVVLNKMMALRRANPGSTLPEFHESLRSLWNEFYDAGDRVWAKATRELSTEQARLLELTSAFDMNSTLPPPFSVLDRPLTAADVSFLYRAMPSDLTSSMYLPHLQVLRSRDDFIAKTYARAQRMAEQAGGNADDLGFSKARLSDLYDNILESMKLDPSTASAASFKLAGLERLRQDLQYYSSSRGFNAPDNAPEVLKKYSDAVLKAVQEDPIAQQVIRGTPVQSRFLERVSADTIDELERNLTPQEIKRLDQFTANAEVIMSSIDNAQFDLLHEDWDFAPLYQTGVQRASRNEMGMLSETSAFDEVRTALQNELRASFGDFFPVYRISNRGGIPGGAISEVGPGDYVSVTLRPHVTRQLGHQEGAVYERVIITPEDVVTMGNVPEQELIIRPQQDLHDMMNAPIDETALGARAREITQDKIDMKLAELEEARADLDWLASERNAEIANLQEAESLDANVRRHVIGDIESRILEIERRASLELDAIRILESQLADLQKSLDSVTPMPRVEAIARSKVGELQDKIRSLNVDRDRILYSKAQLESDAADHVARGLETPDYITYQIEQYDTDLLYVNVAIERLEFDIIDLMDSLEPATGSSFVRSSAILHARENRENILINIRYTTDNPTYYLAGEQARRLTQLQESLAATDALISRLQSPPSRPTSAMRTWQDVRQPAWDKTIDELFLSYPNYENQTMLSNLGKGIAPFLTYEMHRLFWLPRTWLTKPGTFSAWGRYMDLTEDGYVRLPGTSMEINFLRGTIWSGGLRRLVNRDYPDFYDQYPELSNTLDQLSRWGFYPGIYTALPFATGLGAKTGQPQVGGLAPPFMSGTVDVLRYLFPDNQTIQRLQDIVFADRYREFYTANEVSRRGYRGNYMLAKRIAGEDLTDDEKVIWNSAAGAVGLISFASQQLGVLAFRPQEKVDAQNLAKQAKADILGIPVELQDRAYRWGYNLEEYIPYPPELTDELRRLDELSNFRGVSAGLQSSEVGKVMSLARIYWDRVSVMADSNKLLQEEDNASLLSGRIVKSEWDRAKEERGTALRNFREQLKGTAEAPGPYWLVPVTIEEKMAFAEEHNLPAPIDRPIQELTAIYFQKTLERHLDPETGVSELDWEGLWAWRNFIENALPDYLLAEWKAFLSKNDTNLEKIMRSDYENYIIPFNKSSDFVLSSLPPEEQALIRQWEDTDDQNKRAELESKENAGGKIIAQFLSARSTFRTRLRSLDPEVDARLNLWKPRTYSSFQTPEALAIYSSLRRRYGFQ